MATRTGLLALAAIATAGCSGSSTAPSAEENRELDRAAEMLDDAPNSLDQVDENLLIAANAAEDATGPREGSR